MRKQLVMSSLTPRLRAIAFVLTLPAILQGCATTTVSSGKTDATRLACSAFSPVFWSGADTDETIKQAKEHNAAYAAICGLK